MQNGSYEICLCHFSGTIQQQMPDRLIISIYLCRKDCKSCLQHRAHTPCHQKADAAWIEAGEAICVPCCDASAFRLEELLLGVRRRFSHLALSCPSPPDAKLKRMLILHKPWISSSDLLFSKGRTAHQAHVSHSKTSLRKRGWHQTAR